MVGWEWRRRDRRGRGRGKGKGEELEVWRLKYVVMLDWNGEEIRNREYKGITERNEDKNMKINRNAW